MGCQIQERMMRRKEDHNEPFSTWAMSRICLMITPFHHPDSLMSGDRRQEEQNIQMSSCQNRGQIVNRGTIRYELLTPDYRLTSDGRHETERDAREYEKTGEKGVEWTSHNTKDRIKCPVLLSWSTTRVETSDGPEEWLLMHPSLNCPLSLFNLSLIRLQFLLMLMSSKTEKRKENEERKVKGGKRNTMGEWDGSLVEWWSVRMSSHLCETTSKQNDWSKSINDPKSLITRDDLTKILPPFVHVSQGQSDHHVMGGKI